MQIWEYNKFQMILFELVTLAIDCDVSDECSRFRHREMMLELLKADVSQEVISTVFIYLNNVIPNINDRIRFVCEFISDIRHPMEVNISEENYARYERKVIGCFIYIIDYFLRKFTISVFIVYNQS